MWKTWYSNLNALDWLDKTFTVISALLLISLSKFKSVYAQKLKFNLDTKLALSLYAHLADKTRL